MAETVVRQRAGTTTDVYGNTVPDWTAPSEAAYTARGIEPVSSTEDNDGRQSVITSYRVYLDSGADVRAGDRMVMRGLTFNVNGDPADWRGSITGGVVAALKRVEG